MQVRRCEFEAERADRIEIAAPAKINLFFEVLGRREDGFHEIETLMTPIGLFDTLVLDELPEGNNVELDVQWIGDSWIGDSRKSSADSAAGAWAFDTIRNIPVGDDNLAVRAVRLLCERMGIERGVRLRLLKRIPPAAGLGGGSSDAAAALAGANLLWKLGLERGELAALAAELGSDVPFFLYGGPAICRGRGEKIEPIAPLGSLHLVVVRPPEGLSTADVYRACAPGNPPWPFEGVVDAWRANDWQAIGPVAKNRLLEPARRLCTAVGVVLDRLAEQDCPVIGMSGSGSSLFGVCRHAEQARQVAVRLRSQSLGHVWAVQTIGN